jgi:pyrroline-5-carboxylate reductase
MATTLNQNICFIGGGNMAQALIGGLLSRGLPTTRITVSDPVEQIRHILEEKEFKPQQIMWKQLNTPMWWC